MALIHLWVPNINRLLTINYATKINFVISIGVVNILFLNLESNWNWRSNLLQNMNDMANPNNAFGAIFRAILQWPLNSTRSSTIIKCIYWKWNSNFLTDFSRLQLSTRWFFVRHFDLPRSTVISLFTQNVGFWQIC